jgi:hypothetical protein
MDTPIGALADGFEDRLVLEEKGELARWGGLLLYLLVIPLLLGVSYLVSAVVLVIFQLLCELDHQVTGTFIACFACLLFVSGLYFLYREYRSRAFREVAVMGGRLEVTGAFGGWDSAALRDVKVWPTGLSFVSDRGERLVVRTPSEEKRRAALEQLLPGLVAAERCRLDSAGELRLGRSWFPVFKAVGRAGLASVSLSLLGCFLGWQVGLLGSAALFVLMLRTLLRDFWSAGLVLTRTGLGRSGGEVPWSEVESCWTGDFFQEVLRVVTRRGRFTLVSSRNPVVWALLIQELKG